MSATLHSQSILSYCDGCYDDMSLRLSHFYTMMLQLLGGMRCHLVVWSLVWWTQVKLYLTGASLSLENGILSWKSWVTICITSCEAVFSGRCQVSLAIVILMNTYWWILTEFIAGMAWPLLCTALLEQSGKNRGILFVLESGRPDFDISAQCAVCASVILL